MCIILTCEKNVRPDNGIIETCFWNNPDGAGIMWVEHGMVQTSKGFMDESSLLRAIESVPKDSPLVIHMRIATSGGINIGTCHPFPVCRDLDTLHAANTECHAAVAHNGVIAGLPTDNNNGISDTVYFVSHAISDMWRKDNKVTKKMRRRMVKLAPSNRFAILTEDGKVYRVGKGWETVSRGIEASNSSWRAQKYKFNFNYSNYNFRDYSWDAYDYMPEEDSWWSGWKEVEPPKHDKVSWRYELEIDPAYSAAIDDLCCDCPDAWRCKALGAACSDVSELIHDCYGLSFYDDEEAEVMFDV